MAGEPFLRSLPFIILMFFHHLFTRLLVWYVHRRHGSAVPPTLSAALRSLRMVEQSPEENRHRRHRKLAQCEGATKWRIVTRVLLVESVPSLRSRGLSISLITILNTAITGSVGAGALGNLGCSASAISGTRNPSCTPPCLLILLVCAHPDHF